MNAATVRTFVRFQETGDRSLFEAFWAEAREFVGMHAARRLVRHLVVGADGFADPLAVEEVEQSVAWRLLQLPRKKDRSGWFDPVRFGWKADRLRAWLYRIVHNEAAEYCRKYRTPAGLEVTVIGFGDLEFNEGESVESVLKPASKVDYDAFELREIVAECLGELPADQRQLYRLLFVEGLSQRQAAQELGVAAVQVCRRRKKMLAVLRAKLQSRGIDPEWFKHAA